MYGVRARKNINGLKLKLARALERAYPKNFTEIHYAATRGNQNPGALSDQMRRLPLETKTSKGNTALHVAAQFGQQEAIRLLIQAGADKNAKNHDNQTPLHLAACYDVEPIIPQLLVDAGALRDPIDNWTWTPLFWTCYRDHDRTFQVLKNAGAQQNLRDNKQKTPLHWVAETGSVKILKLMIDADRFINQEEKDRDGWTPLFWAAYKGQIKTMEMLINNDARINAQDNKLWTPLFWAAYAGQAESVRYLLGQRARTDIKDNGGKTARDWASTAEIRNLLP
ncbi:MAG: hypothetical protein M1839_002829 [Geoglossum umbratile]|nr:MAG: hypothetical protein M1839_002829 [Geoglossum umbratile]